jgi:hypothetical protein
MHSTRRRNSDIEGNREHGIVAKHGQRPNDNDVARRAYERYEARGREDGHALDDWLNAERDLSATKSDR